MRKNLPAAISFACSALLLSLSLFCAQQASAADDAVKISQAWARATAPGQSVGAAYMTLESGADTSLVKVESDSAGSVEIHSMAMKDGVMQMRMLESLPLQAGKPGKLEPGGFHLMLFDLKQPLKAGQNIRLKLYFKDKAGKTSSMQIKLPVKAG